MGIKDEYQFDYLDDKRRFADQINGALFGGKQVVKPEELEPVDPQTVYLGKKRKKERLQSLSWIRDACGKAGRYIFWL